MSENFKLLGHGFDTVQLSFRTQIPDALAEAIAVAQRAAKESRKPEPVALGPKRIEGEVLRHGGGGGDAIFSTGELGELWFFKLSQKRDPWGVTIKIRALSLLCHGFEKAIEQLWEHANGLGLEVGGYSLGRIDYRFDVQTDHRFVPLEDCLIRPNRTLVRPYEVIKRGHPLWDWQDDPDIRRVLRGTRIETLMIGKIGSGQQLVLYDKRAEQAITRSNVLFESYRLDPNDKSWGLWRIEIRFAGDPLKRRCNVRDIPALRKKLQTMLSSALSRVRYVEAGQEHIPTPRRAVHELWTTVTNAIPNVTCAQPSQFAPERAEFLIREEKRRSLNANIAGCGLSLAAMQTMDAIKVTELAPLLASRAVENALATDPDKATRAVKRAWQHTRG